MTLMTDLPIFFKHKFGHYGQFEEEKNTAFCAQDYFLRSLYLSKVSDFQNIEINKI